ncbi:MAG: Si-specific NAD(P)(+) transhydrogenase [Candidatus Eisenbacteria bacterium]|nr:Si-specific NAD(P)(+) transhydrogenase [Candidatus Eisenbacteria bacterium]
MSTQHGKDWYDFVVIGSGPAGQKAAVEAAKAGRRVLVIEQDRSVGGICVHRGTIPSKALRETTQVLRRYQERLRDDHPDRAKGATSLNELMDRVGGVIDAHVRYMSKQLEANQVEVAHGRGKLVGQHEVEILAPRGDRRRVQAEWIVIAAGSKPRRPNNVPIDHEHILDSDSILSMTYLPESLVVLGGGVIASEYGSIFAALGVRVTMIDHAPRPLSFMDPELTERFLQRFATYSGTYIGNDAAAAVEWNGFDSVSVTTEAGVQLKAEKLFSALGRVAAVDRLGIESVGLEPNSRGHLAVNDHCQTSVHNIYAVGDVIGPPSLASSSAEQGRRAVLHALGAPEGPPPHLIPVGIYSIPEMASVGLTEEEARKQNGEVVVGRAQFDELARAQISGETDGLLKLVADGTTGRILGVHIVGEGSTELVHVGQMGLLSGCSVDVFTDHIFNFPTLAEGYRTAALEIAEVLAERKLGEHRLAA